MPNVKYLPFGTPNTKKHTSRDVLNAKLFGIDEPYNLKFGSEWTWIVRFLWFFYSLFSLLSHLSSLYQISSSLFLKKWSSPLSTSHLFFSHPHCFSSLPLSLSATNLSLSLSLALWFLSLTYGHGRKLTFCRGFWLRWWWGFRFGVGGLWVSFELCFRLWRMWWFCRDGCWLLTIVWWLTMIFLDCVWWVKNIILMCCIYYFNM